MCGVAAVFGREPTGATGPTGATDRVAMVAAMVDAMGHRGPDDQGTWVDPTGRAVLGHDRLSIVDLTSASHQPMVTPDGRFAISYNGEVYNHPELRSDLERRGHRFRSAGDAEVVLAAWAEWGPAALDRFLGMFAFVIWDSVEGEATLVRDRFGVKPLYRWDGPDRTLVVASEIGALHAAGAPLRADLVTWAGYLAAGRLEAPDRTFWADVRPVPAGTLVRWRDGRADERRWYDVGARVADAGLDMRSDDDVSRLWLDEAYDAVDLRFRSDVPVGINLSGGLDSSFLLHAVREVQDDEAAVTAFTFATGDPDYDELPWVRQMLAATRHPSVIVTLEPREVPQLAAEVCLHQREPDGGLPTLAYAKLFAEAADRGVPVLLDGQGLDEQWAGYDYHRAVLGATDGPDGGSPAGTPIVQGLGASAPLRPSALWADAVALVRPDPAPGPALEPTGDPVADRLLALQMRDLTSTKLPRALRYNDRVSMRSSCELREPFLDHRLVELALRQPPGRKIDRHTGKVLLRKMLARELPGGVVEAPKRPVQTPQREWLRGPLADWAEARIADGLDGIGRDLVDPDEVRREWRAFRSGEGDHSFFVWQWISMGLLSPLVGGSW